MDDIQTSAPLFDSNHIWEGNTNLKAVCEIKPTHTFSEPKTCTDCGEDSFEDYDYCKEHLFLEARGV